MAWHLARLVVYVHQQLVTAVPEDSCIWFNFDDNNDAKVTEEDYFGFRYNIDVVNGENVGVIESP